MVFRDKFPFESVQHTEGSKTKKDDDFLKISMTETHMETIFGLT